MENENEKVEVKEEKKEFTHLPKWAFDSEYMTERLREVQFLAEKGIKHTYVRTTPDYNVSQYKYKKTPALFAALVEFYTMLEMEKKYRPRRIRRNAESKETPATKGEEVISPETIKAMQDTLNKYAAQISEATNKIQDDTE